jgi:hypothetical protein
MARKCFMCGREVTEGILCEKCDKPRKKTSAGTIALPPEGASYQLPVTSAPEPKGSGNRQPATGNLAQNVAREEDPFPKAPVLPFPVESASPAITSVVNLLVAAGVPSILLGPDRSVKFVSDEARRIFDATQSELSTLAAIETKASIRVADVGRRERRDPRVPAGRGDERGACVVRHVRA